MNKYEKRSKASYDKKAENYEQTADGKFTWRFNQLLCDAVQLKPGDAVADIACGNGRFLKMLSQKQNFRGCGVDISDKMIAEAQKQNPGMRFYAAGCDKLPFADGEIDAMTVCAAYHHFPDVSAFAKEASRVVKTGGALYIADIYLPGLLRTLCNPFLRFSRAGDVKFYSPGEITALFSQNGFTQSEIKISGITQLIKLKKI